MYQINEIFYSLQGEGANTGTPAIFIRFSGCNLRCPFCDTDFSQSTPMSVEDILAEVAQYPSEMIIFTGGEPSLQLDQTLVDALRAEDYVLAIETNGTHALPEGLDWITVSPKRGSRLVLTEADEVKVVYTAHGDEDPDVEQYLEMIQADNYFLQPCSGENTAEVVAYCLQHPYWSLSLQTHKMINIA